MIGGQLQRHLATDGQQFPPGAQIDDRCDRAIEIPADRHRSVRERVLGDGDTILHLAGGDANDAQARGLGDEGDGAVVQYLSGAVTGRRRTGRNHLTAGVAARVGQRRHAAGDSRQRLCDQLLESCRHAAVRGLRILVDPGDRRAGDDVVELLQQHFLPQLLQLAGDLGRDGGTRRPPQLCLAQQALAATVADLRLRLAGERAAMHLEVQLAVPHGHGCTGSDLGFHVREELVGGTRYNVRRTVEVGEPAGAFDHLAGRATATVAVAVGHQRPIAPPVVLEVLLAEHQFLADDSCVVGVDRWEVREHLRAVEPLPLERAVRKSVLLVPAQLLGDETVATGGAEDLRQRRRVAEHVWDPHLVAPFAEARFEVTLAVHQLARKALAAGQVHVGFHPHRTDRLPLTGGHALADAFEQRRVLALHPVVLRGLRAHEAVLRIRVHHAGRAREGAGALADGLTDGPQPRRVDVCMAHRNDLVRAGASWHCERGLQQLARRNGGTGNVVEVEGVECRGQFAQQPLPALVRRRQRSHQAEQHLHIEQQVEHVVVAQRERCLA